MGAPSLVDIATRAAISQRSGIVDFADMPYSLARPILKRIDDPEQLREVEINCPHFEADDAELWTAFLDRDVPGWHDKFVARLKSRPISYKIYQRIRKLQRRDEEAAEEALREQFQALDQKKKMNETHITNRPLPIPVEYANGRKVNRIASRNLTYGGTSNRPKTGANSNGIAAIRRKVAIESNARRLQQPVRKLTDAEVLRNAKAQIKQAPSSMVIDHLPQSSRSQYLQKAPIVQPATVKMVASRHFSGPKKPEERLLAQANRLIEKDIRERAIASSSASLESKGKNALSPSPSRPGPQSPAPGPAKKRAAPSIFMPAKRRKV